MSLQLPRPVRLPLALGSALLLAGLGACGDKQPAGDDQADAGANAGTDAGTGDTSGAEPAAYATAPGGWTSDPDRTPRAVHLTWQQAPATTITASWTTNVTDPAAYAPRLWVAPKAEVDALDGEMPLRDDLVFDGEGENYQESLLGEPTSDTIYVSWHAEATGLEPDTEYAYRVGAWDSYNATTGVLAGAELSEVHTFRTAPAKGTRQPLDFILAGDSRGGYEDIQANMAEIAKFPSLAWVFNGDMNDIGLQDEWNDWFGAMGPVVETRPLLPVHGNHEVFAGVFYAQFALPRVAALPEELQEHAWSLDIGNIHLIGLDSNGADAAEGSLPWLETDLAAATSDPDIDWIIAMMHHSAYSSSKHGQIKVVLDNFVPLFDEYGVDLVFSGHDHDYERSLPIRNDEVVPAGQGTVYIVAGSFFSPPYSANESWWTAKSIDGEGGNFASLHVDGKTATVTAYDGTGKQVLDTVTFTKP